MAQPISEKKGNIIAKYLSISVNFISRNVGIRGMNSHIKIRKMFLISWDKDNG